MKKDFIIYTRMLEVVLWLSSRGFIRGGNWNNGSNAGVLTLNLNNGPTNTNTNIGFRVARDSNEKESDIKQGAAL